MVRFDQIAARRRFLSLSCDIPPGVGGPSILNSRRNLSGPSHTMDWMSQPIRVGLLFGGQSVEHEVSLQSVQNIIEAMDPSRLLPVLIAIDKAGRWYHCENRDFLEHPEDPEKIALSLKDFHQVTLLPWASGNDLRRVRDGRSSGALDVIFPVLHGPYGEDGTIQGHLKLAQVPMVGCGVLASSLTMDKEMAKRVLAQAGIPHARGRTLHRNGRSQERLGRIVAELGLPLFVKPANLGSSVGISRVDAVDEMEEALDEAFQFDHRVVVEEAIQGQEVECAVLGNDHPKASIVGEILPRNGFYSYQAKYLDPDGAELRIPARISEEQAVRVRQLAVDTFRLFGCRGMARVDFFVTKDEVVVNELNAIPGFTTISMYPMLWKASGVGYAELVEQLVGLALEGAAADRQLRTVL